MFRYASDQSLFLDVPSGGTNLESLKLIPGVVNLHPAYESVLIVFDPRVTTHADVKQSARSIAGIPARKRESLHEIPVRYDGPDLPGVARLHNLTEDRVVELHSGAAYTVAFLGFVPGFAYLEGLPAALVTPRLPAPRREVPAGSVGIAGGQTGIYPIATPGGWQLIGLTRVELFNPASAPMSLLQPGDRVKFVPV